jgi:glutamine synthetase
MGVNERKMAISSIADRKLTDVKTGLPEESIFEIFGENVFNNSAMRESLPKGVYKSLIKTIRESKPIDPVIADTVANAMKKWAIEKGATHYTHWFQPMTGLTAEKHDSFINITPDGEVISEFSGKMLIKGEPDASSFPSGGIRTTFEARGYTAWDPTSPAFIIETPNANTLCIPTAFYSYTGEALDRKVPLMRSIEALFKQALRILKLFNKDAKGIHITVGLEQEYFLIDKKFYVQRPDLINAGRTLYGARPPKGQEMEDHYFGSIRPRVLNFMADCEMRLYKLGIPVKTRHNEVSPAQFEIAPVFEYANVALDHNMLVMETLRSTAEEHGFVCLLHEKPFAGVNGSGKHSNWSIVDYDGNNLLDPGHTPQENVQFLVFLAAVLRAVHNNSAILRIGVSGAGNDHRLGANEAPPAILSVFLGNQLTDIIDSIIEEKPLSGSHGGVLKFGVSSLPNLPKDATDRNRTSPFAFTGNKFEFRAVGSSMSASPANIAINVGVAEALDEIATKIENGIEGGKKLNEACQEVLKECFRENYPVIFNGDNYSKEWPVIAEKRGLLNLKDTVMALGKMNDPEIIACHKKHGVFTEREMKARQEILFENYDKTIAIEAQICSSMGRNIILPVAMEYQKKISDLIISLKAAMGDDVDVTAQKEIVNELSGNINGLRKILKELDAAQADLDKNGRPASVKAATYHDVILPLMSKCREYGDNLEMYIDDSMWPLPKYNEMLWIY